MSNKYILTVKALGTTPEIEIDKERFEKLKTAKEVLSKALEIEKIYEMVINSFIELECESANAAISSMVRGFGGHKDLLGTHFDIQSALNVRVANLLTAIHLYRDQLLIRVPACVPSDKNTKSDIEKLFSQEYDAVFEYRFMYALRNHAQHHGVPVHSTSAGFRRVKSEDGCDKDFLRYSVSCYATKKELGLNERFKEEVLNEMPEKVNLLIAARFYVEAVSRIHEQVREKIKKNVESARADMDNAINEYRAAYKEYSVGLYALEYQGEQKTDEEVSIVTEWDDVRKGLVIKNGGIANLSISYVTSRADK